MRPEKRNKLIVVAVSASLLVFFVWWGSFDAMGDILRNPSSYRSRTVCLFGRTGPVYSVPFVGSLYKLNDTSGSMWVVSDNDSTMQGRLMYLEADVRVGVDKEALKLKGKIKEIFDSKIFGERQIPPILIEKERGGIIASFKAIRTKK